MTTILPASPAAAGDVLRVQRFDSPAVAALVRSAVLAMAADKLDGDDGAPMLLARAADEARRFVSAQISDDVRPLSNDEKVLDVFRFVLDVETARTALKTERPRTHCVNCSRTSWPLSETSTACAVRSEAV